MNATSCASVREGRFRWAKECFAAGLLSLSPPAFSADWTDISPAEAKVVSVMPELAQASVTAHRRVDGPDVTTKLVTWRRARGGSGRFRSPIPIQFDHPFRADSITDSDAKRSPVPMASRSVSG